MKQIDKLDLSSAKDVLKSLRQYADMSKKLWIRWKKLFFQSLSWDKTLKVEYVPTLWEDSAWSKAESVFEKSFSLKATREQVVFVENPSLKWGMKVYCDDNMVDLSFKKVENLLQK